jgi:hypothetical protein
MSDQIVISYLNDMEKKYNLYCFGNGGGFFERVNKIIIDFKTQGPKSLEELRELIIDITEDLLSRYNTNEEIRPYLKNYPFTVMNLDLSILLCDENGKSYRNTGSDRERLRVVYQRDGIISYQILNDEKPFPQEVYVETYEEALMIVRNKKNS